MEKDGVFVFDLNTPYKHEKVLSGQTFDFDEDDAACRWSNRYDPQTGRVDLSIDIHYKDTGEDFHESFSEYSYPLDTVKALLTRYGFDPVKIADGESFGPVRPDSQRWIITAVKQYTCLLYTSTITAVLRKCAQKIAAGEKDKINVTPAMVKAMLGPEKVKPTFISRTDAVGIANGLAWTSVGGEMLPIEVSIIPNGSGKVEITGSLGDVMKESAHLALTYARVHAETYHIAPDKFKNTDIHIHAPEGAVPKDGPSAGVTLTTALISAPVSYTHLDVYKRTG